MQGRQALHNFRLVGHVVGMLLVMESACMLLPALAGLVYGERDGAVFGISALFTAFCGLILHHYTRGTNKVIGRRDGFLITALIWVVFSVFGMLPFVFGSTRMGAADAWFESMSGFTTTGATVLMRPENASHAVLLWRAIMQWIGGLGIILLTMALLPGSSVSGGVKLFHAEVTGFTHDKIKPRVGQTAKSLWLLYIALTLVLVGLLWVGPMDFFDSLCQGLATISTGGFSTSSQSIAHWNSTYIKVVMTVFMFIGGINFALIFRLIKGYWSDLRNNDVLNTYAGTVVVAALIFSISIIANDCYTGWVSATVDPLFQAVSVLTSSGFSCANYEAWGVVVIATMLVLMVMGACAGSTTGGAKIDRMIVIFKNLRNELSRCIYPNSVMAVRVNKRAVDPDAVNKVMAFICIYIGLIAVGTLTLSAFGVPLGDSVFTAFSCVGNMGVGFGITGPMGSFALLPDASKWMLSVLMLIGRLEIFTVLVIFTRKFWHR